MRLSNILLILAVISLFISCRENKVVFPDEPVDAAIFVNSNPIGASIFLRNDFTYKITPDWIENLTSGTYRVTLKYDGYVDTSVSIRLSTSQKKYLTIQLRAEE